MSIKRDDPKRDASEPAIIEGLVKAGCTVKRLSQAGIPDLLVCTPSLDTVLIECKTGNAKHTKAQADFFRDWPGRAYTANSPESALKQLGLGE